MINRKKLLLIVILSKDNPNDVKLTLSSIEYALNSYKSSVLIVGCDKSIYSDSIENLYNQTLQGFDYSFNRQISSGIYQAFNEVLLDYGNHADWVYFLNSGDSMLESFSEILTCVNDHSSNDLDSIIFRTECHLNNINFYVKPVATASKIPLSLYLDYALKFPFALFPSHQGILFSTEFHLGNLYQPSLGLKADSMVVLKAMSRNFLYTDTIASRYKLDGLSSVPRIFRGNNFIAYLLSLFRAIRIVIFNQIAIFYFWIIK